MMRELSTEQWDLYNAERVPLNTTIFRGEMHPEGTYHLVVNVWVINNRGEVLTTLRHPSKVQYPNMWENQGGAVQQGETSLEAVIRELWEETGILAAPLELILLGSSVERTAIVDIYAVNKDVDLSKIILQDGETVDAKWVTMWEFDRMIVIGDVSDASIRRKRVVQQELEQYCNLILEQKNNLHCG